MEEKIKLVIEKIKPYLQMDGGDIDFVGYEDNYIYVRLTGNCHGCSMQDETINNVLLTFFKNELPEIEGVINIPL